MAQRRVLGVSLGSPARDFLAFCAWEGGVVEIRRIGTGGDVGEARRLLARHDGRVDAFGLGGVNRHLQAGGRRYGLPLGQRLASIPRRTPVCDGTCVKAWWEPRSLHVACEQHGLDLEGRRVLFSSALDRWALAEALEARGARVAVGDAAFALGIPVLFPGLRRFYPFAVALVPFLRRLPLSLLYPQARRGSGSCAGGGYLAVAASAGRRGTFARAVTAGGGRAFAAAEVLAGDFHFFRPRLPRRLDGRWVIAVGLDAADLALLRERGVCLVVELGPVVPATAPAGRGGEPVLRGLSANLAEAVVAAASGQDPAALGPEGLQAWCGRLGFSPTVYQCRAAAGIGGETCGGQLPATAARPAVVAAAGLKW
jgi:hypothetical protein